MPLYITDAEARGLVSVDDAYGIIDIMGVDHVLFGSDFPHPEGVGDPISYVDRLDRLSEEDKAKIMGGNLGGLLGIDVTV